MSDTSLIRSDTSVSPLERYQLYPAPGDFSYMFAPRRHLREYMRLLMRRKWVVFAFAVTALAVSAVYTLRQTPIYQASTKVEIDLESANVLPYQDFSQQASNYNYFYEEFLQTQIKHITSRSLASRVVLAAGLDRESADRPEPQAPKTGLEQLWSWFAPPEAALEDRPPLSREERIQLAIGQVQGGLAVTPVKNSRVVEISYSSPDPQQAAVIVNTLASEYIDYNFQAKYDATSRATDFLQKQLVDLKAKVEQSEEALINYARDHNIMNVGEKQDVVMQTLADINTRLTEARSARMDKESVYKTLSGATPDNFPQALRTPLIEKLEGSLLSDEQELARLTAQFGPAMPQVKQLESRLRQARQQLLREQRLAIENARTEYQTALAREKLLADAFDKQMVLANELNESSIQYNIIRREVETNKQLYDGLLQRMKEAGVAAGLKSSNIRVVDAAEVPESPSSPNLRRNLALALMLGLMGGLGLAFFLNYLDNTVKTPEDAEELVGLPSLGLIPSLQSARRRYGYLPATRKGKRKVQSEALMKQGVELASLTAGSSLIAEAYRGLRTALLLSMPENPPRTILVTSAKADEGKTTTVCNTALSLAQTGKKVLILDCDMRRPKIRKIFSENGASGLSEYLTGQADFAEIVHESTIPNLYIAHSGTAPPNPGELLGSDRMQDAIKAARGIFDFIIIDTPPLMSVTDPLIVAPMTDGVILVTKGGKSPPEILRKAKKSLEFVRARILGVLFNNVDLHSADYHYYYHQYFDYDSYVSGDTPSRPPAAPA